MLHWNNTPAWFRSLFYKSSPPPLIYVQPAEHSPSNRSPPPSFTTGNRPPSYQSSHGSDDGSEPRSSILNGVGKAAAPCKPKRQLVKEKKEKVALKPIPEKVDSVQFDPEKIHPVKFDPVKNDPEKPATETKPPPFRRYFVMFCLVAIILVVLFAIVIIVLVVLIVQKSPQTILVANSTATVVSTVKETATVVSTVQETATVTASTLLTTTTSSTSTSSSVVPTPTNPVGGFDAFEFADTSAWMFYTDQQGNIRHIQSNVASYYDTSATRTWSVAYPEVITSGVRAGSAVQVASTNNFLSKFHVFFVATNGTLQQITTTSHSVNSGLNTWRAGNLGTLNITASDSMFLRVCIPWRASRDYGAPAADLYLYYSAPSGGINKLGWWDGSPPRWRALDDLPQTNTRGVLECQNDLGGIENAWIVDDEEQLVQLSHNSTQSSPWVYGALLRDIVHPDSSILSITSSLATLGGRTHIFYQDINNNIQRLDVNGHGSNSVIANTQFVDQGTPGTRLATTNTTTTYCSSGHTITIYYQRNTSEIMQYYFKDEAYASGSASSIQSGLPISNVQTYGPAGAYSVPTVKTFSPGEIFGIAFGAFVALLILIGCCIGVCS